MAVLNKIREQKAILIFIIAMALVAFVISVPDLLSDSSLSAGKQNIIATINGEDIKREDFMNKVEAAQRQLGGQGTSTQAMNRVWDQEIRKAVMESQFDALGLVIERDQMRDLLKQSLASFEEFKDADGIFDENKLNEFIANLKAIAPESSMLAGSPINYQAWTNYESTISAGGRQQTYFNMVKAGVIGTLAEGELDYKLENDKVDIKFVQIPFSSIPDSTITVSKSDITNYINKNKSKYVVDASRDIYFVHFKEEASLEDEANIQKNLQDLLEDRVEYNENTKSNDTIIGFRNTTDNEAFVNANSAIKYNDSFLFKSLMPVEIADSLYNLKKGDIYGPYKLGNHYMLSKIVEEKQMPDSVKVRHILIPFIGAASADPSVTQTEEEAKKTADSVLNVVKRNRSKFSELVTALSSDRGSIENGGRYDWHPYNAMVPQFRDFTFENNTGDIAVVKTDFGFHIIEIEGQKNKQKVLKIATIAQLIEPSEQTIDRIFNETSKFEIAVASQDFQDVAKESNYSVRPVSNIGELDESIPSLGNQRAIVRWAFEDATNVGDIKRFNIQGGGYAVVMLTAINKEGLMSVEKASVTALPEIRKEKKAELIKARITATTLEDIAKSENQTVKTALAINMKSPTLAGAGREPKVIGAAFGLKEGQTSKPIVGNLGVYFVQTTKITPAEGQTNYQAAANRVAATKVNAVNTVLYNALKNASEIDDNRATFY
ncbi:MAG: peptidylprolyl isomerase [Flavobacteriaceae bacterium]|nr:peptidylprolyl isomerase [Flavobacteriaceae bacterium]